MGSLLKPCSLAALRCLSALSAGGFPATNSQRELLRGLLAIPTTTLGLPRLKTKSKAKDGNISSRCTLEGARFWHSEPHTCMVLTIFFSVLSSVPHQNPPLGILVKINQVSLLECGDLVLLGCLLLVVVVFFFFPCRMGLKKIPRFYLNVKQRCCRHSRHSLQLRAESQNALFAF